MVTLEIRGSTKRYLEVAGNQNIGSIKDALSRIESVLPSNIRLYFAGIPLKDDTIIASLQNPILDFGIPLLGGKVHGSLARAGKVKGQTPKVEPSEKKKKKKAGRVRRRMNYNRRFVNAVQFTFGRKCGPNANL